jgi:DNA-binding MarR family transcriptional regulator
MGTPTDTSRDFVLLEQIEQDPDTTQATLAARLGVAVGTVNWHLKRLISKGYIKVRRVERRKLRYLITSEGIALRARLALDYIQTSFELYRLVRNRMINALNVVQEAGFDSIRLEGEGDVADICRLTCLEQGVMVVNDECAPRLFIQGVKVFIDLESCRPPRERQPVYQSSRLSGSNTGGRHAL